tara:strand:- start:1265 stop:2170 length:906 start_codon:yes stop_codon:yes gene_type:complete
MCGCYSDCIEPGTPYLFPGIAGNYQNWRWEKFDGFTWSTIASGTGTINDLSITTSGTYTIRLYVETTDGCDGYSCEVDLTLTRCSEPCEGRAKFDYVNCSFSPNQGVVYEFGIGVDFAPFGKKCDKYTYQIVPPVGSIISPSNNITPYGSYIVGKWLVGSNYYPGGKVCFDIIITNECDQTTCTFEVCFEFPKCGDPRANSKIKSGNNSDSQEGLKSLIKEEIYFYPNPSNGMLKVSIPEEGNYDITIFDFSGRVVFRQTLAVENPEAIEFNLQDLPFGPYHIQFIGNNTIKTGTLIMINE